MIALSTGHDTLIVKKETPNAMSGLAQNYGRIVKRELNAHAAWFPITNTLEVGDFGLIEDGVFRPIGKIPQKYPDIEVKTQAGPKTEIHVKTEGTTSVVLDLDGNVKTFQALGDAEGQLKISFKKENAVMLESSITSKQMTNIDDVAKALNKKKDWKNRFKVVSSVYVGEKATVLCSRDAGTELSLKGKADVLKAVEAGNAGVGLAVTSNKSGVFHSVGETGVIAIELFKLKMIGGGVNTLGDVDPKDPVEPVSELEDDI